MKTILFQGDSITDAGRSRDNDRLLGMGYANFTAGKLGLDYPSQFKFYNRGVSANRVVDLYARIKSDIINLNADYMSVLIGVNDVWHEISKSNGVSSDKFYKIYDMLISEVRSELPDIKILILEPFVLRGTATNDNYSEFRTEVEKRALKAKEVAEKHNLIFVPLQKKMDELAEKMDPALILSDGVHPTYTGHELISRELYRVYNEIL